MDVVSVTDVMELVSLAVSSRRYLRIHTLNVDHVVQAHSHPKFARSIETADVVVPDGMPIVWVLRRRGLRVNRITGVDLMENILRVNPFRVVLIGGRFGVAARVGVLASSHGWKARVVGTYSPARAMILSEQASTELVREVRMLNADVVFVGFGAPLQEEWLLDYGQELGAAVVMGVGGAFDILGGVVPRAPSSLQDHGLEWLYRTAHDPVRLGARYFGRDWRFIPLCWQFGASPAFGQGDLVTQKVVSAMSDMARTQVNAATARRRK